MQSDLILLILPLSSSSVRSPLYLYSRSACDPTFAESNASSMHFSSITVFRYLATYLPRFSVSRATRPRRLPPSSSTENRPAFHSLKRNPQLRISPGSQFLLHFHAPHQSQRTATPNLHALRRIAPCVTAPASAAAFPPTMQVPRHAPPSLSLGSLGVASRPE